MRRVHKKVGLALAAAVFLSASVGNRAEASSLEDQKQEALDEIESLKSDIQSVEEQIEQMQQSKDDIQSYITQLDAQMADLEARLTELAEDIETKEGEIADTQVELEAAIETVNQQYEAMKLRIQYTYENGGFSYLTLLLESDSISDFLNRAEYATQMVEYDRRMLEEYQLAQQKVEDTKAQLETEQQELEDLQADVTEQRESLDELIDAKTQEIADYQAKIANAESEADDYSAQLEEQERLLEQIEEQIAQEAARKAQELEDSGTVTSSASGFVWPCPSSHRITSSFGPRSQPTAGASTNHKGIDIGASTGSAIIASASGVVTTAAYSSSAGNYVVISHGGGISTVYMHCSALYVSAGQTVSQGETIAAVGSTGYSTGPHLHFGVIVNGSYVDPLGYVS